MTPEVGCLETGDHGPHGIVIQYIDVGVGGAGIPEPGLCPGSPPWEILRERAEKAEQQHRTCCAAHTRVCDERDALRASLRTLVDADRPDNPVGHNAALLAARRALEGGRAVTPPGAETGCEHRLKTWPVFFAGLIDGTKTAEVRRNDRAFWVGDRLVLCEFDPEQKVYTGREEVRTISRVDDLGALFGLRGIVLLSFLGPPATALTSERDALHAALASLCDDLDGRFTSRFIAHNDPYAIELGVRTAEARRALEGGGK